MTENREETVQNKLLEVADLVEKFESQSKQILKAEKKLVGADASLKDAAHLFESKIYEALNYCENVVAKTQKETQTWVDKATNELFELTSDAGDALESIKDALEAEQFMDLCDKLRELSDVLDECKQLKEELSNMKDTILESVNSKIEIELAQIKKQQEENRKFMEEKFFELLNKKEHWLLKR